MREASLKQLVVVVALLEALCLIRGHARKHRSVPSNFPIENLEDIENNPATNNIDFIWSTQTVAAGDTAVLHCSFDAIFSQLRNGNIDWVKENAGREGTLVATGKKVVIENRRYRVYRPHNSALSVFIIRRTKKRDAGIFRCNLSGSSTRHKYLILNVTESKIEAQTSPARMKARIGKDITLWCNATGYPRPVVYWTREDSNRKLPDGSYQFWGNALYVKQAAESDTGIYACYLDNFVQPVVSYKFSLIVEDRPWHLDGFKMRFDSSEWFPHDSIQPRPVQGKSFLLMCETRGVPKPLPKIRWFKDDREIRSNKHFYIIEDQPEWRNGYISSTLVVMKFVPRHQANYSCTASNGLRQNSKEFMIKGYEAYQKGSEEDGYVPEINYDQNNHIHNTRQNSNSAQNLITSLDEDTIYPDTLIPNISKKGKIHRNNSNRNKKQPLQPIVNVDAVINGAGRLVLGSPPPDDEDYTQGSGSGDDQDQ